MPTLKELKAQQARLESEIAQAKAQAVKEIRAQMAEFGITLSELGNGGRGSKRPVKYRDDKGHTWTGVGQRPRWVVAALLAGHTLEEFLTPEAKAASKAKAKGQ